MLKKQNRLKKRKEFGYIYKHGSYSACKTLSVIYCPAYSKPIKIGFSVSSKVGNAVIRNRIKRQLRSIVSTMLMQLNNKYNYIFVARIGIDSCDYSQIQKSVIYCLNKAGLLNEEK